MRCPSCNKFPAYDMSAEPEVDVEVNRVTLGTKNDKPESDKDNVLVDLGGSVRIVLTSECCGEEMKEANFDIDISNVELHRADGCTCDLTEVSAESDSGEITDRSETFKTRITKRGPDKGKEVRTPIPYRYQRRFYGVQVEIMITDEVQASGMDELV